MESMSLKHCQILIQTCSLSAFSLSEPGSFSRIMLPHCSIILISFHRGTGSGAYGMEDTLQSGNLLTESITHMWQHVLSWEDSRGRERGVSLNHVSGNDFSAHRTFLGASFLFVVECVGELHCVALFLYHCLHSCQRHRPPYTPYTPFKPYTPCTPCTLHTPYTPFKLYTPCTPYTPCTLHTPCEPKQSAPFSTPALVWSIDGGWTWPIIPTLNGTIIQVMRLWTRMEVVRGGRGEGWAEMVDVL